MNIIFLSTSQSAKGGQEGMLTIVLYDYIPTPSRHRGRLPETSRRRSGMRRPAGWLVTMPPGRRPAKPPFRHYERNVRTHQCGTEGTAHVHRLKVSPRRAGANKSPRWSAERRASPMRRKAPRKRLRASDNRPRRVPRKHPSACRRSAPSLCVRGSYAKLGGFLPREEDGACSDFIAAVAMREQASRTRSGIGLLSAAATMHTGT
jgi:hypothetical protein